MMKLISVIVPVYNVSQYLRRCLDSILNNTWRDLEIICVNDGSTDDSLRILREYEGEDPRIIVIDQENGGVSAARNAGLRAASGEFIAFIDSDDWIHPQYFEVLMHAQSQTNADCVVCGVEQTDCETLPVSNYNCAELNVISTTVSAALANRFTRTRIWGRVYKRSLLDDLQFVFGIRLAEDTIFNLSALCGPENLLVCCIREKMYFYFMREESAVHTLPHNLVQETIPYYISNYNKIGVGENRIYLLDQAYRFYLSSRYLSMFDKKATTRHEDVRISRMLMGYLRDIPYKKRVIYWLFLRFPGIYRLYRIYDDKTMLQWEKEQKWKRRNPDNMTDQ